MDMRRVLPDMPAHLFEVNGADGPGIGCQPL